MKYSVFVTFAIEGFHCWPEAKDVFPEVGFLSERHRHMFHFKCYAYVTHTDRDEEFIRMKRRIEAQIKTEFGNLNSYGFHGCEFGRMSCEDLGNWILTHNENLYRVEVSEDNENGAIIERN